MPSRADAINQSIVYFPKQPLRIFQSRKAGRATDKFLHNMVNCRATKTVVGAYYRPERRKSGRGKTLHSQATSCTQSVPVGTQSVHQGTKETPQGTPSESKASSNTKERGRQATTMPPNQNSTRLYLVHMVGDAAVRVLADVLVEYEGDVLEDEASVEHDVGPWER